MSLPAPKPAYDQQDQAQTRRQTEQLIAGKASGNLSDVADVRLTNASSDSAAAAAGVKIGSLYVNGSQVMVRQS